MFFVSFLTVGYKLALPEPPTPLFSCTAEELGMRALVYEAEDALKTQGIEPDFSEFEEEAFQDMDIDILYDMALAGVEDPPIGVSMDHLKFELWFEPFLNATTPVHPYAALGTS